MTDIFSDDDIVAALDREYGALDVKVDLCSYLELAASIGHPGVLYMIRRGLLLTQLGACECCGQWTDREPGLDFCGQLVCAHCATESHRSVSYVDDNCALPF